MRQRLGAIADEVAFYAFVAAMVGVFVGGIVGTVGEVVCGACDWGSVGPVTFTKPCCWGETKDRSKGETGP